MLEVTGLHAHYGKSHVLRDFALAIGPADLVCLIGRDGAVDVALAMIEEDLGRSIAIEIARFLVVYVKRRGEERQLSAILENQSHSDKFDELHAWILANLSSRITLGMLAQRVGMSVRNFSRAYVTAFGRTPMNFILTARLDVAARALTGTADRISQIAFESGFSSEEQMRRHLLARYGMSPGRFRAAEEKVLKQSHSGKRRAKSRIDREKRLHQGSLEKGRH